LDLVIFANAGFKGLVRDALVGALAALGICEYIYKYGSFNNDFGIIYMING
jgi:hypothetical protein